MFDGQLLTGFRIRFLALKVVMIQTELCITFTILTYTYPCSPDVKFMLFSLDHNSELEQIPPLLPQWSSMEQRFPSQQSWTFGCCVIKKAWISKKDKITVHKNSFSIVIWSSRAGDVPSNKLRYPNYHISSHGTLIRNLIRKLKSCH